MNPHDPSSTPLTTFLRQHRPEMPLPSPYLEQRIMERIQSPPTPTVSWRRWVGWVAPLLLIGIPATWMTWQRLQPSLPMVASDLGRHGDEVEGLEGFLSSYWDTSQILQETISTQTVAYWEE